MTRPRICGARDGLVRRRVFSARREVWPGVTAPVAFEATPVTRAAARGARAARRELLGPRDVRRRASCHRGAGARRGQDFATRS